VREGTPRTSNEYSLDINEQKTRIIPTSSVIAESWPYDLEEQLENALNGRLERYENRIVSLLGTIVDLSNKEGDDGIIKYFVRRLDRWHKWDSHWELLEPFLAHVAIQYSHCIDYVAQIVSWRVRTDRNVNRTLWTQIAKDSALAGSENGRDSEVIWSIWLLKELGSRLHANIYDRIIENNSPLVIAALVHFSRKGLLEGRFRVGTLWDHVEGEPLAGRCWPLALELNSLNVKPPAYVDLAGPEALKAVFDEGCSLFEWDRYPLTFLDADDELEHNPERALSSYGSDYDDEDDEEPDIDLDNLPDF
jgi:hypothetical protein